VVRDAEERVVRLEPEVTEPAVAETRRLIPEHVPALDRPSPQDEVAPPTSHTQTGETPRPLQQVPQSSAVMNRVPPSPGRTGGRWERGPGGEVPIRVTIGRIEVRAAAPAPPPAVQIRPVAGPRMNLEDYLRRRREGKL
jgi:hypothetical protein